MSPAPGLRAVLRAVSARLARAGISTPETDAALLVAHVLGISRQELAAATVLGGELTAAQAAELERLVACREHRVPLQHLTGQAPFRSVMLTVGPGVFVPRPETEVTAQLAIDELTAATTRAWSTERTPVVVDLCTGSGAIAVAIAVEVPDVQVYAVEVAVPALAYAHQNVARAGVADRVLVLGGDARDRLAELEPLIGRVDVVTCNPPYIPPTAVPVDPEVRDHDPPLALYGGGPDGLELPTALAARARQLTRPGGLLVMEHADGQWPELAAVLTGQGWQDVADHADLAGRSRVTTARAP